MPKTLGPHAGGPARGIGFWAQQPNLPTIDIAATPATASLALSATQSSLSKYAAGQYDETGATSSFGLASGTYTELEFGLVLDYANLANGDTLDFRVYLNGQPLDAYDVTARLTAVVTGSISRVPAVGTLTLSGQTPTASVNVNVSATPAVGSLALSGQTPTAVTNFAKVPTVASLTLAARFRRHFRISLRHRPLLRYR